MSDFFQVEPVLDTEILLFHHNFIQLQYRKMFQLIAILATFACAAAFSASSSRSVRSALKMGFENEIGVQPPLGTVMSLLNTL